MATDGTRVSGGSGGSGEGGELGAPAEGPDREPVSVLLPTREWGPACEQLAGQLGPTDELLVICDTDSDPVAQRFGVDAGESTADAAAAAPDPPDGVEILVAGEPEGCSAKANALAYGMEHAANDRFVWTDDDFERGEDWLDRLVTAGETHGPAAVFPLFRGSRWWWLFEPVGLLALAFTYGLVWGDGADGYPWGGGVTFTREDLDVDALVADLRRALSDDNVLHDHLGDVAVVRSMRATVTVDGGLRPTAHRLVRWMRADHVRGTVLPQLAGSLALVWLAVAAPIGTAATITALAVVTYARFRFLRPSFALAYPALFVLPVVLVAGIVISEVEWGGRRYRIRGKYEIEVVEAGESARSPNEAVRSVD